MSPRLHRRKRQIIAPLPQSSHQQICLRLISVFLEIFHKGCSACTDFIIIALSGLALFMDITRRIFEVPRPEVRYGLNIGIIGGDQAFMSRCPCKFT